MPRSLSGLVFVCLLGFIASLSISAQTTAPNEWTYIGNGWTTSPEYGRLGASTWVDSAGNLWMYGGYNNVNCAITISCALNDMWEYSPSSNGWTQISGSDFLPNQAAVQGTSGAFSPTYSPGSRYSAASWTDSNGNFWLFGGGYQGLISNANDLWEFNPTTKEWAWISGSTTSASGVYGNIGKPSSANNPGARQESVSWTDSSGNFWLFGGYGIDANGNPGPLNDLWMYSPSANAWTWESGSSTLPASNEPVTGVYGNLGSPSTKNYPGGRRSSSGWIDSKGNLWLFGGYEDSNATNSLMWFNDLWEFNRVTGEWAWMNGSNSATYQTGTYGTLGQPAAGNTPGSRYDASSWIDKGGHFWLFGGNNGVGPNGGSYFNDLWELDPSTNLWAWMGGTSGIGDYKVLSAEGYINGPPSAYGTAGVPTASNNPGGRETTTTWIDESGNFWLYGGLGLYNYSSNAAQVGFGFLSELWIYQPSTALSFPTTAAPTFSPASGNYSASQSVTISDTTPNTAICYTTDGVTAPTTGSTLYTGAITVSGTETIQAVAVAQNYLNSAVASATFTFNPPDYSIAASPSSISVTGGQSGTTSITVTPEYGFNSVVNFACSGLPSGASCSFLPGSVTPSGGAASTTLTVTTSASSAALRHSSNPLLPYSALAVVLCCIGWKRPRLQMLLLLAVSATGMSLLTGCGGSSSGGPIQPSQPVTSMITVTAISGSLSHTATFSLTVN